MKKISLQFALALIALICGVCGTFAQNTMKQKPVMWAAEDLKWAEMKNAPPGVSVAKLWGDMTKGAYGSMVKFSANQQHPLHIHSGNIKLVVVEGTFVVGPQGGPEKSFGPGSYLFIPGGWKHTSGAGSEGCTIFQEGSGKFDMTPVKGKGKK